MLFSVSSQISTMTHVRIPDLGGATMLAADVGGLIQPHFMKSEPELRKIFDEMPNFPFRKDDVVVFSYPKAGKLRMKICVCRDMN